MNFGLVYKTNQTARMIGILANKTEWIPGITAQGLNPSQLFDALLKVFHNGVKFELYFSYPAWIQEFIRIS